MFMKMKFIITALAVCLCVAPATWGQTSGQTSWRAPIVGEGPLPHIGPPETPEHAARRQLAEARQLNAAKALNAGKYADAEDSARQAIADDPYDAVAREELAEALSGEGRTAEAIQAYRAVIYPQGNWFTNLSQEPRILLPYALLMLKTGQWPEAVFAYEKALPNVPGQSSDGLLPKINAHFDSRVPQPVALEAALYVALGLTNDFVCDQTGTIHRDRALVQYQKALELMPDWDVANCYYAFGLKMVGRHAEAAAAFAKAAAMGGDEVKKAVKLITP